MPWIAAGLIVAALVVEAGRAQAAHPLDQLLGRMGDYLARYETELSSVVADEIFDQRIFNRTSARPPVHLTSEVAFMRLPGNAEWLGFRDVKQVNGKPVKSAGLSITEVLSSNSGDIKRALAIANASARYNLGLPRTINVPTAPLDIIHPRFRDAHRFAVSGTATVEGTPTVVISFEEVTRPTLVRDPGGLDLVSSGRIWLEASTGRIWRVEWFYQDERHRVDKSPAPRLIVEFEPHQELGFMVPARMTEVFMVAGARGEGKAVYRNFRRFGTSARIVPQ
jgi:hypothetical protein